MDIMTPAVPDPLSLARFIDERTILRRIQELAREDRELRILLRAVRERDRYLARYREVFGEGGDND
jgi:hypothetical protein